MQISTFKIEKKEHIIQYKGVLIKFTKNKQKKSLFFQLNQ